MGTSGWLMLVLRHYRTPPRHRSPRRTPPDSGAASGPLMIAYSARHVAESGTPRDRDDRRRQRDGDERRNGMGSSAMTAGMGWDAGMATLAILMLVSGLISDARRFHGRRLRWDVRRHRASLSVRFAAIHPPPPAPFEMAPPLAQRARRQRNAHTSVTRRPSTQ